MEDIFIGVLIRKNKMKITKFNNFRMLNKVKKIIKLINGHRYMFLKKQV
jgi:hypothetical protein